MNMNRAALVASIDRAFDFAAATLANVNQGGLFDMMGDDAHGSSTQSRPGGCDSVGHQGAPDPGENRHWFYLSGHLFDEVASEVRKFVRTQIDELIDSREPQVLAGIVSDFRVINGQRGKLGLFKIDDKSGMIEASADEALLNTYRNQLKEDEFVVVVGRPQMDSFQRWLAGQGATGVGLGRCALPLRQGICTYCHGDMQPDVKRLVSEFRRAAKKPRRVKSCTACACAWACAASPTRAVPWRSCSWVKEPVFPDGRRAGGLERAGGKRLRHRGLRVSGSEAGHHLSRHWYAGLQSLENRLQSPVFMRPSVSGSLGNEFHGNKTTFSPPLPSPGLRGMTAVQSCLNDVPENQASADVPGGDAQR